MHPSRRGRRLGGLSGGWVYLSVHWPMVFTCLGEEDHLLGYHADPRSRHTRHSASAPFPRGEGPRSPWACSEGARACWGGGSAFGPAPFLWGGGGVGVAKSLLPSFLVPKGNQPTACTLALWWLKFGPTEGGGGARGPLCPAGDRRV